MKILILILIINKIKNNSKFNLFQINNSLNKFNILYSGNMYNAGLSSGVHFGFSGASDSVSFLMRSGKIYDPQNKVVYSYSDAANFSLHLDFNETNYSYSFDEEEFCANGIKNNFAIDKFFFNSNGLTCDVTTNIYGPEINYAIVFPEIYSSSSLTGVFTNSILLEFLKLLSFGSLTASTAGFILLIKAVKFPSLASSQAPFTAPQAVWPNTTIIFVPANLQANSMLPNMSSFTKLPATLALKISPIP